VGTPPLRLQVPHCNTRLDSLLCAVPLVKLLVVENLLNAFLLFFADILSPLVTICYYHYNHHYSCHYVHTVNVLGCWILQFLPNYTTYRFKKTRIKDYLERS
jgi:hypothetical protein